MGSRDGWRLLILLLGFLLVAPTCRAREAQPLPVLEEEEVVADAAGGRGGAGAAAGGGNRRAPVRHELSLDFYAKTCPAVDQIVGNVTAPRFRDNPAAGPAVLRLFYHDCFVEVRTCTMHSPCTLQCAHTLCANSLVQKHLASTP